LYNSIFQINIPKKNLRKMVDSESESIRGNGMDIIIIITFLFMEKNSLQLL
jgi:hypothetical protein